MAINYSEEVKRLSEYDPTENSEFWKPTKGQYSVTATSELEEADPYVEDDKEPKPQVKIKLKIDNGKEVVWTMGIGKSPASAYGQLCDLAIGFGGSLKDKRFKIVVTNDGKKNSYTIVKP